MLYDLAAELGINAHYTVLDAGCGIGTHSCELAHRFGCHVIGLDPAENNLEQARALANQQGLTHLVTFQQGSIDALPFQDTTFDFIWCRDMLVHVHKLKQSFLECARVLKSGGTMLIYTTFATDLMEPREATRLYRPLDLVEENMSPAYFEETFKAAGLQVYSSESIGGEWMEALEEREGRASRELMRIARMKRAQERFMAELGQTGYDVSLALYHWHVYLLLGKLSSTIYTLRKSP